MAAASQDFDYERIPTFEEEENDEEAPELDLNSPAYESMGNERQDPPFHDRELPTTDNRFVYGIPEFMTSHNSSHHGGQHKG